MTAVAPECEIYDCRQRFALLDPELQVKLKTEDTH
jgi:hypothetical protein